MSKVFATDIFNVDIDRAFKFAFFFFSLPPSSYPKSLDTFSISDKEAMNFVQQGKPDDHLKIISALEYPKYFVVDQEYLPGALFRWTLSFTPVEEKVAITWEKSIYPVSFFGRIATKKVRKDMEKVKGEDSDTRNDLLRFKNEIENTNSGLEEAFQNFISTY